jgi:hypothetical protein
MSEPRARVKKTRPRGSWIEISTSEVLKGSSGVLITPSEVLKAPSEIQKGSSEVLICIPEVLKGTSEIQKALSGILNPVKRVTAEFAEKDAEYAERSLTGVHIL